MSINRSPGAGRRTAAQRALSSMRQSARKVLEPLLKPATQDAVLSLESDLTLSSSLKSSARNILAGYAAFSDAFFAALDNEMDAAVEELLDGPEISTKPAPNPTRTRRRSLSLVDYDQMEEQTMVDRAAARLRNAADSEYGSLTQRVARALRLPALGGRENPFHPLRYCRALGTAVDKLGFKGDERQAIIKAFEVPLQKPLVEVYSTLNAKLERQGVPDGEQVRVNAPVAGGRVASDTAGPAPQSNHVGGSVAAGSTAVSPASEAAREAGAVHGTTAEQLLTALFQRMHARPVASLSGAVPAVPSAAMHEHLDALGPTTHGFAGSVPIAAAPVAPRATGSVSAPVAPEVPVQFAAIDPALLASINEVQRMNALATMTGRNATAGRAVRAQDEHQLRQQVAEKATRQVDKLTIELVGMVFDRIHQDNHIPAQIKIALARLQFPVMKVALADVDLFVSSSQPARRLMDRIASTAIGWHPEGDENERYLAEVNKAINTVLLAINEGPAIFEKALDDFETYLAEERGRDDDPITRARRALEEAEKREAMAINAAVGVRRAFDGMQIEPYLREFLLDVWVKVLVAATLRERTEPDFARRYRDAVSDLVWSVQPKGDLDDRKRLVKTIPAVLNTLREGLQLIDVPFSAMRSFFTQLMASHAQAAKANEMAFGGGAAVDQAALRRRVDEVPIEAPPAEEWEQPRALVAEMLRDAMAANHAEVNLLEEAADAAPEEMIPVDQLSDDAIDALIDGWQRGSWFDVWTGEETERVRLRWVSPRRHFYLFTSAESGRAHSLAPSILRGYVRAGRIKPAEKTPLFQRVVDHLLRDLQGEGVALAV
ncbi:MAG TPA: DUF1631 family protein [Burkholderiaceae bacterium]|nr:DUF1631 family protein [Burkholderiaceae bacterium]